MWILKNKIIYICNNKKFEVKQVCDGKSVNFGLQEEYVQFYLKPSSSTHTLHKNFTLPPKWHDS